MKLHHLEITNIASIEHAKIDFDSDPIAGADVFLISGPTGAGKSTILDAIALALYGRVPRFGSVRRRLDDFDNIAVNDVRQILRQGTGKGEILLTFDGNDGCSYESTWTVRRAHDKADRNFQRPEWTLVCNGDKASALTKAADIQEAIVAALGIDYEQFIRTSMLAQGEFTRFLKADDSEKSQILTKLTRTDIYAKIGRRIFETTRRCREDFELKKQLVAGEHLIENEEIEQLKAEQGSIASELAAARAEAAALAAKTVWLERSEELKKLAGEAAIRLEAADRAVKDDAIMHLRNELDAWRATAPARAAVRDIDKAQAQIDDANSALALLSVDFASAAGAVESLVTDSERKKDYLAAAESDISDMAWQFPAYEMYDAVNSQLDGIEACRKRAAEARTKLAALKEKRAVAARVAEAEAAAAAEAEKSFAAAKERLAEAEANAAKYDFNALASAQKGLQEKINLCTNLIEAMKRYASEAVAIARAETALAAAVEATRAKGDAIPALVRAYEEAREEQRLSDDLVKVLNISNHQWAKSARATLVPGCRCPVCLQTVENMPPVETVLAEQWRLANEKADANRVKAEHALAEMNKAKAEYESMAEADRREALRINESKAMLTVDSIRAARAGLGLNPEDTADLQGVAGMRLGFSNQLEESAAMIAAAEAARKFAASIRTDVDNAHKAKDIAMGSSAKSAAELKIIDSEISSLGELVRTSDAEADETVDKLSRDEALSLWRGKTDVEFRTTSDFKTFFSQSKKTYDAALRRVETLKHERSRMADAVLSVQAAVDSILVNMPEWTAVRPVAAPAGNIVASLPALAARVAARSAARTTANAAKTRADADLHAFENQFPQYGAAEIRRLAAIGDTDVADMESRLRKLDDALLAARSAVAELSRQTEAHNAARPQIADGCTPETLRAAKADADARIAALHTRGGSIASRLAANDEALRRVAALKAEADVAEAEWRRREMLNVHFGSATGDKFNRIAQSFVLRSLLDRANVHLSRLTSRYRLRGVEGQYTILLEDAENDFRCRPVITGSGGESFLVSLSLALALAEEGRDVSTDILFIDEGFGTLSGEPLQRAVAMLRSLHSASHKQVGIISHVEELKTEIPVRIQVTPTAGGASAVDVVSMAGAPRN